MISERVRAFAKAVWNMEPSKAFFVGTTIGALSAAVITLGILENEKKHEALIKIFSTAVSTGCGLLCIARANQRDREREEFRKELKDYVQRMKDEQPEIDRMILRLERQNGEGLPRLAIDNTKEPDHP